MKYRKKPIVIEAFRYGYDSIPDWYREKFNIYFEAPDNTDMKIETLEGTMTANKGDWIIQGVNGEIYPCKPDIFEKTYELVGEQS